MVVGVVTQIMYIFCKYLVSKDAYELSVKVNLIEVLWTCTKLCKS